MEEPVVVNKGEEPLNLPPGFRFHPTDEEIITCYLIEKVMNSSFSAIAIGEADLNKCEPWDLPKKAKMGEKDWYFFCLRDRKYPTGMRTNRATESGYWKATGKDKEIFKGKGNLVGMKKTLVFYRGRAPKGEKSNWVMHEFRLEGKFASHNLPKTAKDEWVVSKIFHKNTDVKKTPIPGLWRMNSFGDDLVDFSSLPPLVDPPYNHTTNKPSSYIDNDFKCTSQPSSSTKSTPSYNYYNIPSFFTTTNNNINQMLIKPEDHRNYETNQGNFSNPMGSTLSQHNMLSDYYIHEGKNISIPSVAAGSVFWSNNDHVISGSLNKQCKMEQLSTNQSVVSVSQDTCMSNDRNTDTSSVISKLDMGRNRTLYEDLEGPSSSVAPLSDLECLWDDY